MFDITDQLGIDTQTLKRKAIKNVRDLWRLIKSWVKNNSPSQIKTKSEVSPSTSDKLDSKLVIDENKKCPVRM